MDTTAAGLPGGSSSGFVARLSARGKAGLAVGAAGLLALVAAMWLWSHAPDYRILFTNLSDRDGGAIIAQLSQMNIPYRNADGGTLLVPADRVHEARLKLASQGLPKGSLVGFELMENQKFGVTQFQEQVNYQRGLEGELSRSISSLATVAGARVHLALPKQSGFLRDKQPPTASVVVQLFPGKTLDRSQVAGIVHLVSSSVPEMSTKNVSIVDQQGNLLTGGRDHTAGLDAQQLDYVAQIESATIRRIEDILAPLMGPGNVRAQVTADIDFSSSEQMAESYKPNQGADGGSAIRSQQTNESSDGAPGTAGGVPGALTNQPPVPGTAPITGAAAPLNPAAKDGAAKGNARREAVTNYEVDKTVLHTRTPNGQVRRMTAAVIVNHKVTAGKDGAAPTTEPLSEKDMQNVQALVREAMGFNEKRGDSVNVVNAAFNTAELVPADAVPFWKQPEVVALGKEGGKALLFLVMALIIVLGVVRPALRAFAVRPAAAPPAPDPAALPAPAAGAQSTPVDQLRLTAKADPATVANVVRGWVNDGDKAAAA